MRATLIHNPSAGDTSLTASAIKQMVGEAGFQLRYRSRKNEWKKALRDPTDLVVAAGGDGTVSRVALELAGTDVPLAILPLGTANNIARALGVVGDAHDIVAGWRDAAARPIDIGVVSAPWGEQRFIESAGGGVLSQLIEASDKDDRRATAMTGARGDRALSLLESITREARPTRWEIELDGRDLSGDYLAVEAMNIRFAGPKVPLAPNADPGDGLLDVVLLSESERSALLEYLGGRLRDAAAELPDLPVYRGRQLRLRSVEGVSLHAGDKLLEPPDDDARRDVHDVLLKPGALTLKA